MVLGLPSIRPQMPSRRHLAAMVASRLGVLRAIRQARANAGLLVMAYHRIGDPTTCPVDEQLFAATRSGFIGHLNVLKRWTRICSLDDVVDLYRRRRSFTEPMSLLTFDDVYWDNYEAAFPLIREVGATAVFFVPTAFIEQRGVPWWDRIAYAVKHSRHDVLELGYPAELRVEGVRTHPRRAAVRLLRRYKADVELDKERYLAAIESAAGVTARGAPDVGDLFCSWKQLRAMAAGGMSLESHTHSHRLLGHLSYEEQLEELVRSREVLREKLGIESRAVAYPVGGKGNFNEDTRRAMTEAGYRIGFSNYGGWNAAPEDHLDIRRLAVDMDVTPAMLHAAVTLPRMFNPESPVKPA